MSIRVANSQKKYFASQAKDHREAVKIRDADSQADKRHHADRSALYFIFSAIEKRPTTVEKNN